MTLRQNVGPRERYVRFAAGAAALVAAASFPRAGWRWLLAVFGVSNVVAGALRHCPTHTLLGTDNTKGRELLHFAKAGRLGRRINRLQRRVGATV